MYSRFSTEGGAIATPLDPPDDALIAVARIARPWGRRGEVIADLDADDVRGLAKFGPLRAGKTAEGSRSVTLLNARVHGDGRAVLQLEESSSIDEAETLRGLSLWAERDRIPPAPEGRWHAYELIGLQVRTRDGEVIGCLEAIQETGGADLLVVRSGDRERLIPFARSICTRVEPSKGFIEIDPPEGLLEL